MDPTPACAHQARNARTACAYARRVFGLRMLEAKNSRKRMPARLPAATTNVGTIALAETVRPVLATDQPLELGFQIGFRSGHQQVDRETTGSSSHRLGFVPYIGAAD